ncbi:DUF413 domain-containing protein [Alginatibacterium sediminis]|uniref:Macrodomain Ori protein n=1 Tax=Alginatibacterium sediminis TaxID=2164068 RepID=A0A420EHK9_9ALTE|nr:DUF413 domain-containing protein [Alginatibacterium sediminis]RKF20195.1 DUF413 domain-containing protein [Alginatibacterium sediminis]
MSEFRSGSKRFYDDRKFPKGFSKSGCFTLNEAELLSLYGDTMLSLENGSLSPENADEKHFLKVLKNPSKASSAIEHLWLKYTKLARGRRNFHTLNSYKKSPANDAVNDEDDYIVDEAI